MTKTWHAPRALLIAAIAVACLAAIAAPTAQASPRRHKKDAASANGPTARLYRLLDQSMGGKLNIYLLADIYTDPSKPGQAFQRVLHVLYNKDLYFGRFVIHSRSVAKLTQEQLAIYTPEQVFNFAERDSAKFEKINAGPFGQTGDLYLMATDDHPPSSAPITNDVQQEYDMLLSDYILPAVQKQASTKP